MLDTVIVYTDLPAVMYTATSARGVRPVSNHVREKDAVNSYELALRAYLWAHAKR